MVTKEKIFAANEFISDFESSYTQVKRAIERSQERHKKEAEKHRRTLDLKVGQYVLLRFEKARLQITATVNNLTSDGHLPQKSLVSLRITLLLLHSGYLSMTFGIFPDVLADYLAPLQLRSTVYNQEGCNYIRL